MQSSIAALAEKSRDGGDQSVSGWLENNGCGRPPPERGIDPPSMEDERDAAVEELPADERAVRIAEIEIQDARRDVGVSGQTERLVQMRSGQHLCAGRLQAPRGVEADQRLIFDEKDGASREVHAFHHALQMSV